MLKSLSALMLICSNSALFGCAGRMPEFFPSAPEGTVYEFSSGQYLSEADLLNGRREYKPFIW